MTSTWCRRPLATVAVMFVACWLATACAPTSGRESGTVGSSGAAGAAIGVEQTSSYLTIENRAGMPLVDIRITLKTANGLSFTTSLPRLESGAKRDLPYEGLRSNDGTSFSPRWQKPREIAVTAADLVAKKYELTIPWR